MSNKKVLVSEIFGPVIQGEGPVVGRPTIFLRTFGCDSYCRVCDTLYAVDPKREDATYHQMTIKEIIDKIKFLDTRGSTPVTISGGNPALWDLFDLVSQLKSSSEHQRQVWVETQGTIWREWFSICDKVIVSPKGPGMKETKVRCLYPDAFKYFLQNISLTRLFLKIVIFGPEDIEYAVSWRKKYPDIPLYLSVGNKGNESSFDLLSRLEWLIEQVLKDTRLKEVTVLPQLHVLVYGGIRQK
ncbi:MAG: 7-carboxy-7-deazaguanine synthase QueE [Nitrosopumilaceae archaeon]|nr:7-carboxy-7-deazaguanine synthase QueE [Nitrosopumilaceae archaeon]NIU87822.1 7-carboxy-7-deazaguanine synthase QueE [Nitrosopumilaceae archaeon]NIV65204.1 7-carboxy-7-deazaguanine synthase QueE [Nitrosopumilaceae archaeon]NIX61720.1 7-carboxy-7-deazaguanine synthase QueE [Nitrosopumilaceae archaeon]